MKILTGFAAVACGLLLMGWAPKPEVIGPDQTRITFVRGHPETLRPARSQFYDVVLADCDGEKFAKRSQFILSTKSEKSHVIEAGRITFVFGYLSFAQTVGVRVNGIEVESGTCFGQAAFKTLPGHTYTVVQRWNPEHKGCGMLVMDDVTGQPPPGLKTIQVGPGENACRAYETAVSGD